MARAMALISEQCSSGSDVYHSDSVLDEQSASKQGVSSARDSLQIFGRSADSGSSSFPSVVISIHDAIFREQKLAGRIVADTNSETNIDRICSSNRRNTLSFVDHSKPNVGSP